jgi:hypothetical protein
MKEEYQPKIRDKYEVYRVAEKRINPLAVLFNED